LIPVLSPWLGRCTSAMVPIKRKSNNKNGWRVAHQDSVFPVVKQRPIIRMQKSVKYYSLAISYFQPQETPIDKSNAFIKCVLVTYQIFLSQAAAL